MYCTRCREELTEDSRYCKKCGKRVGAQMPLWGWLVIGAAVIAVVLCIVTIGKLRLPPGTENPENGASTVANSPDTLPDAAERTAAPTVPPVWPPVQRPTLVAPASADSLFEKGMSYLNKGQYFNGLAYVGMAANEGSYSAQFRMYVTYSQGDGGMPQEDIVAAYWNRVRNRQSKNTSDPAAGKGLLGEDAMTQEYERSVIYFRDKEYSSAIAYLGILANEGDASAQYLLGQCYMEGVRKDRYQQFSVEYDAMYTAGIYWMQLAAEQGHCCAQGYLGYCYRRGRGVEQDLANAFAWDRLSARQNCPFGLIHIGYFYTDPLDDLQFAEKNYYIARMFYEAAGEAGHFYAKTRLGELEGIITSTGVNTHEYVDELDVCSEKLAERDPQALIEMQKRSEGVTIPMVVTGGKKSY